MQENGLNLKVNRIYKLPGESAIKAFVDINVNENMVIKGFRIVEGPRGLFVTMPQEKGKNDRWYNTVRCLNRRIQAKVTDCILDAYRQQDA